jgi:hypothetical protein
MDLIVATTNASSSVKRVSSPSNSMNVVLIAAALRRWVGWVDVFRFCIFVSPLMLVALLL